MRPGSKFIFISVMALVFFAAGCADSPSGQASSGGKIAAGQRFVLKNLEGDNVSLTEELRANKAVLLNFWATWCPPCREEIPGLIALQEKHKDKSFTIIGVDVGESSSRVAKFAKKMKINYPIVLDEDSMVSEHYGVVGIPTSLLILSDGTIVGEYHAYTRQLVSDVERVLQ